VTVYLVRHAKAGDRDAWLDDDFHRPLSERGHLQARALLPIAARWEFDRVLSSPYTRCMETMVPIAAARGIALEPSDALAEYARLDGALALVRKHMEHGAVMCLHGDLLPALLEYYAEAGVDVGKNPQWPKGCTWVLEGDASGEVRSAEYLPPPSE
jgi:8-oxo-dGTP diphosphatase